MQTHVSQRGSAKPPRAPLKKHQSLAVFSTHIYFIYAVLVPLVKLPVRWPPDSRDKVSVCELHMTRISWILCGFFGF